MSADGYAAALDAESIDFQAGLSLPHSYFFLKI